MFVKFEREGDLEVRVDPDRVILIVSAPERTGHQCLLCLDHGHQVYVVGSPDDVERKISDAKVRR